MAGKIRYVLIDMGSVSSIQKFRNGKELLFYFNDNYAFHRENFKTVGDCYHYANCTSDFLILWTYDEYKRSPIYEPEE